MNNMEVSVAIARFCTYREIKNMLSNTHSLSIKARVDKHKGQKTISRRDSKKEKAYGDTKKYMTILNTARTIKKTWSMEEVNEFLNGIEDKSKESVNQIKKLLKSDFNKVKEMNIIG